MTALAAALSQDPQARRKGWLRVGGAGAAIGVGLWSLTQLGAADGTCGDASARLVEVWDDGARAELHEAFAATGHEYAADLASRVETELDGYVEAWGSVYADACEARREGEESDLLFELRMRCLEERRSELSAFVQILHSPDDDVLDSAVLGAQQLRGIDACSDQNALLSRKPLPGDPQLQAQVDEVVQQVAEAKATVHAGHHDDAERIAREALEQAEQIDYEPVLAEALLTLGEAEYWVGDAEQAEKTLLAALTAAAAGRDDEVAARAWPWLVWTVGYGQRRPEHGLRLIGPAEAAVLRAGNDEVLRADLLDYSGVFQRRLGQTEEAENRMLAALEIRERVLGSDDVRVIWSLNNLGNLYKQTGDLERALRFQDRAYEARRRIFGERHPEIVFSLSNLASLRLKMGEYELALDLAQQGYELGTQVRGPRHIALAELLTIVASCLAEQGRDDGGGREAGGGARATGRGLRGGCAGARGDATGPEPAGARPWARRRRPGSCEALARSRSRGRVARRGPARPGTARPDPDPDLDPGRSRVARRDTRPVAARHSEDAAQPEVRQGTEITVISGVPRWHAARILPGPCNAAFALSSD